MEKIKAEWGLKYAFIKNFERMIGDVHPLTRLFKESLNYCNSNEEIISEYRIQCQNILDNYKIIKDCGIYREEKGGKKSMVNKKSNDKYTTFFFDSLEDIHEQGNGIWFVYGSRLYSFPKAFLKQNNKNNGYHISFTSADIDKYRKPEKSENVKQA